MAVNFVVIRKNFDVTDDGLGDEGRDIDAIVKADVLRISF